MCVCENKGCVCLENKGVVTNYGEWVRLQNRRGGGK